MSVSRNEEPLEFCSKKSHRLIGKVARCSLIGRQFAVAKMVINFIRIGKTVNGLKQLQVSPCRQNFVGKKVEASL